MTARPNPKQFALFTAKQRIAAKIEALIAVLDAIEGDPDFEIEFPEGDQDQDIEFDTDTGQCVGWPERNAYWGLTEFSPIQFTN